MYPKYHLLFGIIFSLLLFLIFPEIKLVGFLIIIFSTFLIDFDHYLAYAIKKKDLNLKRAIKWIVYKGKIYSSLSKNERDKRYIIFCFFHGFELVFLFFILGFFVSKYFLFVSIGIAFHIFLDIIDGLNQNNRFDRISLIWDYFKFKKLKSV